MTPQQITDQARLKFTQAAEHFSEELKKLRTGRAHPGMLDGVMVEAYGVAMPLNQVATVSAPEAQLLQITPFDPTNIQAITTSIRNNQTLGLNPMDDGRVVRVSLPLPSEERRRDLVKQVGVKLEECMVSLRAARHEALSSISQAVKDKDIGEDEAKRSESSIDQELQKAKALAEAYSSAKEKEIMTV